MTACTRCNGSGTEPEPAERAYRSLMVLIDEAQIIVPLKDQIRRLAADIWSHTQPGPAP